MGLCIKGINCIKSKWVWDQKTGWDSVDRTCGCVCVRERERMVTFQLSQNGHKGHFKISIRYWHSFHNYTTLSLFHALTHTQTLTYFSLYIQTQIQFQWKTLTTSKQTDSKSKTLVGKTNLSADFIRLDHFNLPRNGASSFHDKQLSQFFSNRPDYF